MKQIRAEKYIEAITYLAYVIYTKGVQMVGKFAELPALGEPDHLE